MRIITYTLLAIFFALDVSANSYPHKALKIIPKADSIIAFSNGRRPATGKRRKLTKDEVLTFLSKGRKADWGMTKMEKYNSNNSVCDGVIVDKSERVYFWKLVGPKILHLEIEGGETAYLYLR